VIRHIDVLEVRLAVKLFQRHARGYNPTEAGEDLLLVAEATHDQFSQLANRIKGRGDSVLGELVVTSMIELASWMVPLLVVFQKQNPDVTVLFLTGDGLFLLECGEAHVAIRAGTLSEQSDNVVQPFKTLGAGLFAHKAYVAKAGLPTALEDYGNHRFVIQDNLQNRAPYFKWLRDVLPVTAMTFRCLDANVMTNAVLNGAGIGFVTLADATAHPDLVEVRAPLPEWESPLWLVTHVDLHHTPKAQALLRFFKDSVKGKD
jgi:DNA-binding transcriptional LysR family regulator